MSTRNKWMDWKPGAPGPSNLPETVDNPASIFFENAKSELTKPTEPGFVSFVSDIPGVFQKIEAEAHPPLEEAASNTSRECKSGADPAAVATTPAQERIDAAGKVLAQAGVRLIGGVHGVDYIGVWSDLDSAELRAAIAVFHPNGVPVRYLDGDVPRKYKLRRVPGEPVPANVLAAMQDHVEDEPWVIRDRMLEEMNWTPQGIPWATWKAEKLNRLFKEQGVRGQQAEITSKNVQHGERGRK